MLTLKGAGQKDAKNISCYLNCPWALKCWGRLGNLRKFIPVESSSAGPDLLLVLCFCFICSSESSPACPLKRLVFWGQLPAANQWVWGQTADSFHVLVHTTNGRIKHWGDNGYWPSNVCRGRSLVGCQLHLRVTCLKKWPPFLKVILLKILFLPVSMHSHRYYKSLSTVCVCVCLANVHSVVSPTLLTAKLMNMNFFQAHSAPSQSRHPSPPPPASSHNLQMLITWEAGGQLIRPKITSACDWKWTGARGSRERNTMTLQNTYCLSSGGALRTFPWMMWPF